MASLAQETEHSIFQTEELDQQLDLLQHLLQFGDELLLLTGSMGVGKSTMLVRLMSRMGDGWNLVQLSGPSCHDVSQLFQTLTNSFGFDTTSVEASELLPQFQQHLQGLDRQQRPAVIIDNADELSSESLETLVHLSRLPGDGGPLLRILLAARPGVLDRLSRPPLSELTVPRVITIQPLDEAQSLSYIQHQFMNGDGPLTALTSRQLKGITSKSGGIPLQLDKMVQQQQAKQGQSSLVGSWQFWVGMLALVGFLALVFWPTPESAEKADSDHAVKLPNKSAEKRGDPVIESLPPLQVPEIRPVEVRPQQRSPLTSAEDAPNSREIVTSAPPPSTPIAQNTKSEITPQTPLLVMPVGAKPTSAMVQPPLEKPIAEQQEAAVSSGSIVPSGSSTIQDEAWLQGQPADSFTIQLFASSSSKSLKDMVTRLGLRGRLAQFAMWKQGRMLYVLTEGSYSDRQQAEHASASMPASLKPWVRSIGSIHQLLAEQKGRVETEGPLITSDNKTGIDIDSGRDKNKQPWKVPEFKDAAWLWGQDPTQSTIQLIAAGERGALRDFVAHNRLQGDIAILELERNQAPWYILLMGRFQDKSEAKKMINRLPDELRNSSPWARSFASIHDELSQMPTQ